MFQILQHRTTKTQKDDLRFVVWEGGRKREAEGQLTHHLKSSLDMIMKHDFFAAHDFEVNLEDYSINLYDEWGGVIYHICHELQEV